MFARIKSSIQKLRGGQLTAITGLALWAVLLTGYFFSTQPRVGLFFDNQSTYFVQGLRLSGRHPYLDADWFAQTKPLHIVFTYLVAFLNRLEILPQAMFAFDIFFRLVFLASLGLMANALCRFAAPEAGSDLESRLKRAAYVLSILSIYLLSLWPVHQLSAIFERLGVSSLAIAWEKFGFYYSLGGFAAFRYYTEPASFSVLIFTALALLPYRRWRWSAALLGIAALMHASFLVHSGILTAIMAIYLYLRGNRGQALWVLGIFSVLVLPLVIYILTQMTDPLSSQANAILALERVPHHTQPARWWDVTDTVHAGVILLAAALLIWRGRGALRWVVPVTAAYVGAGIAAVALGGNPNLAILMPWRASGYLFATAQLVFLTAGLFMVVKVLRRWPMLALALVVLVPLAFLLSGVADHGIFTLLEEEYQDTTTQAAWPFIQRIQSETEADALLIIPLRGDDYRLGARRAVYVDWKSHPYLGTEVLEWWQRVQFVRRFYSLDAPERQQACREAGADYYVLESDARGWEEPVVIDEGDLVLIPCP